MSLLPLRRLLLAFALVLTAAGCDSGTDGPDVPPPGGTATATGAVANSFSRPVQGASVTMDAGAGKQRACTTTTDASGAFACGVPAGTYTVTVTVAGYGTQTVTATVGADGTTTLTVPPVVGQGAIDAELVNAVTGLALAGATVECRRQLADGTYGGVEFTGTATAAGQLVVAGAFTGEAQCTATAGGVAIPLQITITTNTTGTVAATPAPASGTYRVVLTWGEAPRDLDSHLTGPAADGDRFHVYFSRRTSGGHNLDVDDTSGYGPETITIVPDGVDGMYRYSVHNYSEQGTGGASSATEGIASSGATVRLYDATGLLRTYTPPAPTAANGGLDADTWRVFELSIGGGAASIVGSAPAGIGYQQANGAGDVTVFLTGGPSPVPPAAKVEV